MAKSSKKENWGGWGSNRDWGKLLPSVEEDVNEENLDLFFDTMFDRQDVWYKRFILKEDRPWTEDKIFNNNKFTNVYRELDRHSQWQIKNVVLKETDRKEMIFKLLTFRIFNKPELFDFIGKQKGKSFKGKMPSYYNYDGDELLELVTAFRETGENPFTNAYYVNSTFAPGSKDHVYCNVVLKSLHELVKRVNKACIKAKDPEEIVSIFKEAPGVGQFIAHEFYQDFTYVNIYTDMSLMKFDQNDYTNVGPGASIGIRLIFPSLSMGKEQEEAIHLLRDIANEKLKEYGKFKYLRWNKEKGKYDIIPGKGELTLHQIEMWLCEFSKYWKMKVGLGKQRSAFIPNTIVK